MRDRRISKHTCERESISSYAPLPAGKTAQLENSVPQQNMQLYSKTLHLYRMANQQLQLIEARSSTILEQGDVNEICDAQNAVDKARALLECARQQIKILEQPLRKERKKSTS